MNPLIIKKEDYSGVMERKIMPELEKRKREFRLERQPGKPIYCVRYKADHTRGTVIISHGFTETAEKYEECIFYFLRMGLDTFCIEHCGHGRSYRLTDDLSLVHTDSYERYVQDLLFLAEYVEKGAQTSPLILYGHSMGGGIGAAAAAKRPDLFSRLILSSPMIQPETRPVRLCRMRAGIHPPAGYEEPALSFASAVQDIVRYSVQISLYKYFQPAAWRRRKRHISGAGDIFWRRSQPGRAFLPGYSSADSCNSGIRFP